MKSDELLYLQSQLLVEPEIVDIETLIFLPDNPKLHSKQYLRNVIKTYGFRSRIVVNRSTMHIIGGNGRVEDILNEKKLGKEPPKGVALGHDGNWYVAVDFINIQIADEIPLAVVYNRTEELGGWDQALLAKVIPQISEDKIDTIGFEKEIISALQAWHADEEDDDESWEENVSAAVANPDPEKVIQRQEKTGNGRNELTILRYIVKTDVAKLFRKAIREALKKGETDDINVAIEFISNNYIDALEEA